MHYIWLFLITLREFSTPFGIPSIVLTVGINAFIFLNLIIHLCIKGNFKIPKILLVILFYFVMMIYNYQLLGMINLLLCCYLLRDVRLERIVAFNATTLFFLIAVLLMGIQFDYISMGTFDVSYKGGSEALTFGFGNPNMPSGICFQLVILLYYLSCRYKNLPLYLLCLTITILAFNYTHGRTYFLSGMLLLVSGIFFYKYKFFQKIRPLFLFIPLLAAIYIFAIVSVKSGFIELIKLFSWGRYHYYNLYFSDFSMINVLIGKPIPQDIPLDNFYIALFAGGIINVIIFCFLYFNFVKNEIIKNGYIFAIVFSLLFSGFFESRFLWLTPAALPLFWLLFYKSAYSRNNALV